jgi:hypothetical protein
MKRHGRDPTSRREDPLLEEFLSSNHQVVNGAFWNASQVRRFFDKKSPRTEALSGISTSLNAAGRRGVNDD